MSSEYKTGEIILDVKGVNVSRSGVPILRNLDLQIHDLIRPGMVMGQVVGLLGPSGMGKTTLFRALAGLDPPDSGSIKLMGKPVERGLVGVVAQSYPLFAHRTVLGNLTVLGGMPAKQRKAEALQMLERFGIAEHAHKYPSQLSGGQRQRVAIVQQFLCSEHILLMDEPFSGLDPLAVDRVIGFINEVIRTDEMKTFILVTHDVAAALAICDTVWLMGRDYDAEGKPIAGAHIKHCVNLIERNIAWTENAVNSPQFFDCLKEIRELFPKL